MRMSESRRETGQRELFVTGHFERREGVTTALLDLALANARRDERVLFLCRNANEARQAFRIATDMLHRQGTVAEFSPRHLRLFWPEGGCVEFHGSERNAGRWAGVRATVVVMDEARASGPEVMHAHTVIKG